MRTIAHWHVLHMYTQNSMYIVQILLYWRCANVHIIQHKYGTAGNFAGFKFCGLPSHSENKNIGVFRYWGGVAYYKSIAEYEGIIFPQEYFGLQSSMRALKDWYTVAVVRASGISSSSLILWSPKSKTSPTDLLGDCLSTLCAQSIGMI